MSRLRIRHGAVRRGRHIVLEAGEITAPLPSAVAVLGINGSGKSSLFMHLAGGLARRADRLIQIGDARPTLAYVPQAPALPAWLRAESVPHLYGLSFDDLTATMPRLHLHELAGRRVGTLSGGQRQVLAIAVALGRAARLTVLDEPFSALDFRRRAAVIALLREWRVHQPGSALLLSSQAAADVADVCDHYVVIRAGRYAFNGPRADLMGAAPRGALEDRLLELVD